MLCYATITYCFGQFVRLRPFVCTHHAGYSVLIYSCLKKVADPSLTRNKAKASRTASNATSNATTDAVPAATRSSNQESIEADPTSQNTKKRKREEVDQSDPKLQEFLGVMLPGSSANKIHDDAVDATEEPPTKVAAVAFAENESDDEYEDVPSRRKREAHRESHNSESAYLTKPRVPPSEVQDHDPQPAEEKSQDVVEESSMPATTAAPTTDDDWLRSRTNRLLDLVDEDDDIPTPVPFHPVPTEAQDSVREEDKEVEKKPEKIDKEPSPEPMEIENSPETDVKESDDNIIKSIRKTSRLFVRNLPYVATEDDLRKHFEQYGNIEEVRRLLPFPFILITMFCMMNPR